MAHRHPHVHRGIHSYDDVINLLLLFKMVLLHEEILNGFGIRDHVDTRHDHVLSVFLVATKCDHD